MIKNSLANWTGFNNDALRVRLRPTPISHHYNKILSNNMPPNISWNKEGNAKVFIKRSCFIYFYALCSLYYVGLSMKFINTFVLAKIK